MNALSNSPLDSLRSHQWFKLICGASYQHLPAIRNLALVYTLAGADCIDMAPDPAVIASVRDGIAAAQQIFEYGVLSAEYGVLSAEYKAHRTRHTELDTPNSTLRTQHSEHRTQHSEHRTQHSPSPWLMVSFNDGADPHFRKAEFNSHDCPTACDRPCVAACPTGAIEFTESYNGVTASLCYGCGRCLPLCPVQIIHTREQVYAVEDIHAETIDAIEIHTQPGRVAEFRRLWQRLTPSIPKLKLVAVSFPDCEDLNNYLHALLDCMRPLPCQLIWQADGRPMSGDIGSGATRAAVLLGQKVLNLGLPFGFVQVAGGTNDSTISKLRAAGVRPAGVAYGSYARQLVTDLLERGGDRLEEQPQLLWQAVARATNLVSQIKDSTDSSTDSNELLTPSN